ncbi:MAG: redoxin domain-containing protein [Actinobacteria bacterium]|nr:redoxin domain-containing protein [Actinomycetota bacterium]
MKATPFGKATLLAAVTCGLLVGACGQEVSPQTAPAGGSDRSSVKSGRAGTGAEPVKGPDFTLATFDGSGFRLADHRGTPVVLNFWESW